MVKLTSGLYPKCVLSGHHLCAHDIGWMKRNAPPFFFFCISTFVCELVRSEYNVIGIFYLNAF